MRSRARATQKFIDIAPEALRKRMRHGNVYRREKVDTALANFFGPRNLAALRQIGLRLVADSMASSRNVVSSPEDVLVAVSGSRSSEELMRRGARLARRRGRLVHRRHRAVGFRAGGGDRAPS
jgi:two-component system, OmpR family, sensor histidine kinase KdpD